MKPLTNCPNCGAPIKGYGYCDYCNTRIDYPMQMVVTRPGIRKLTCQKRLPEINTWVLTYRPTIEAIWPAFLTSYGDWIDEDGISIEITHWMPLPEPPKEET